MNSYISVSLKKNTARKFKEFAKTHGCSYSELLNHMIAFFIGHQLSPLADFDEALSAREEKLLKRINNAISIIRNIEKTQTQPTLAILETLMLQNPPKQAERPHNLNSVDFEIPDQNKNESIKGVKKSPDEKNIKISNTIGDFKEHTINQNPPSTNSKNIPKDNYSTTTEELKSMLHYLISTIKTKKQLFGKDELILDITREEFRRMEIKIKRLSNVH